MFLQVLSENVSKQRKFHYRRVPRADEIYFPESELCQNYCYDMSVTLGYKPLSYSTVKNWVARFRTGHLRTADETFWKTNSSVNFRNHRCHSFHDPGRRKISAKMMAEALMISRKGVAVLFKRY
jgi:hypothetical protein